MDIRRHKLIILFFSFIFIGVYSAALVYAVTYVTPGSVLDPSGTPGNYTVGFATAANEVLYTNDSNQLSSDDAFLRKPTLIDQPDQTIGTTAFSEVSNTADSDNISLVGIGGGLIVTDNFNRGLNGTYIGVVGEVVHQGTGTLSTANGNLGVVINSSTGIVSDARGTTSVILNIGGGTLTNGYAFYASTIQATNKYGVYIDTDDTVNVLRELQLRQESPLKLFDGDSSNYVAFKAPNSLISNTTYEWPDGYGSSGDVLTSDGAGGLSWSSSGGVSELEVQKTLSAAQVAALDSVPYEMLPAPSAGTGYLFKSGYASITGVTTQITPGSGDPAVLLTCDTSNADFSQAASVIADAGTATTFLFTYTGRSPKICDAGPLYLFRNDTASGGDGTFTFTVRYEVVDLP